MRMLDDCLRGSKEYNRSFLQSQSRNVRDLHSSSHPSIPLCHLSGLQLSAWLVDIALLLPTVRHKSKTAQPPDPRLPARLNISSRQTAEAYQAESRLWHPDVSLHASIGSRPN
jgi:hypothetical protein